MPLVGYTSCIPSESMRKRVVGIPRAVFPLMQRTNIRNAVIEIDKLEHVVGGVLPAAYGYSRPGASAFTEYDAAGRLIRSQWSSRVGLRPAPHG